MLNIAITNQKGGVGKTTTTVALGTILAARGLRVLMVDLDPQGSLSEIFGLNSEGKNLADVFGNALDGEAKLGEILLHVRSNLSLAPSNIRLSASELGIVARWGREIILKSALEEVMGEFDVALVDCPPSMGLLTANGIVAAHGVIIPSMPAESDFRGVRLLLRTLERVKSEGLNPEIQLLGILMAQFDFRTNEHKRVLEMIKSEGHPLLGIIPRSVRVQEAVYAQKSVIEYDPKGKPSQAYMQVAKTVMKWLEENEPEDELGFMKSL